MNPTHLLKRSLTGLLTFGTVLYLAGLLAIMLIAIHKGQAIIRADSMMIYEIPLVIALAFFNVMRWHYEK